MKLIGLTVTLTERELEQLEAFTTAGIPGPNFFFHAASGDDLHAVIDRQDGTFLAMQMFYAGEDDDGGYAYEVSFNRLFEKQFDATVCVLNEMLQLHKDYQKDHS